MVELRGPLSAALRRGPSQISGVIWFVDVIGGAVRINLELDSLRKVDPVVRSEKLIGLRNSLDFIKSILKNPQMMECALTL